MLNMFRDFLLSTFRRSESSSTAWNITKTMLHTLFFYTVFLALCPYILHTLEGLAHIPPLTFPHQRIVALIIFVPMTVLGLSSGVTMARFGNGTPLPLDCASKLVIQGPYRYVRNPMAVAGLSQGAAVGIALGSYTTLLYVIAGLIIWDRFVRPIEEDDLFEQFGEDFQHYTTHVRCWIPRITPYSLGD